MDLGTFGIGVAVGSAVVSDKVSVGNDGVYQRIAGIDFIRH